MMELKTIGHLLILIGISFLILSSFEFMYYNPKIEGPIDPNEAKGEIYGFAGPVGYDLRVEINETISIYVLDYENTMRFIETHDIDNVSTLVSLEDTRNCSGVFHLNMPGQYGIFAISEANETQYIDLDMNRLYPHTGLFVPSVIMTAIGLLGTVVHRLIIYRNSKE
ncbi:MAG: hypothetical protein GF309_04440 [Candidatus Lokiarchaeota archaeon]|nr:hypothetical protein [Candidatus Lokiarchaeota archaeon]